MSKLFFKNRYPRQIRNYIIILSRNQKCNERIDFTENKLTYTKVGDYYIPNLTIRKSPYSLSSEKTQPTLR